MSRLLSALAALFAFAALLPACKPEPISIELPAHEPKLVISSVLGTVRDTLFMPIEDSALLVTVSRSVDARSGVGNEPADSSRVAGLLVGTAQVFLTGGGLNERLEPMGNGVYMLFSPQLRTGVPYTLSVLDTVSRLTCTATTTYQPQMRFASLTPHVTRADQDTTVELEYALRDKPGRSFYVVQVTPTSTVGRSAVNVREAESILNALQEQQRLRLLTDNDFRDGRYTLLERLSVAGTDTLLVGVAQISEDYFRFLQAYERAGKVFNQISGEPINYPTNVSGGYGFFNLHSLGVRLVDLNQY